jgi:tocopherol cyclase
MYIQRIRALFNPEQYHGWGRKKKFFEGWYFKVVNATKDRSFAFIPGVAMDEVGNKQAFIQILDGQKKSSEYVKFDFKDFTPSKGQFRIQIEENTFSASELLLNLKIAKGKLIFKNQTPWPKKIYSPGIMGPFSFVPKMECYHGIVSMYHEIEGELVFLNESIDFTGGIGYMEKDWGHSFPSAYVWMQSSHFSEKNISLKLSVAKIPWMKSSFVGFIAGFWYKDKLIRFTTYNFTQLKKCTIDTKTVEIVLVNRKYKLEITAERDSGAELAAPIGGFMDARISETMSARLHVKITDRRSKELIFNDVGEKAGLEVAGQIAEIIVNSRASL